MSDEEVDMHVDPIEEMEEGTVDSRTMDEIFAIYFGPNAEIDFGETTLTDLELHIGRPLPATVAGMQDVSLPFL
jgi:hypothetical protein